jgi:hypothetical protein
VSGQASLSNVRTQCQGVGRMSRRKIQFERGADRGVAIAGDNS